MQAQLEKEIAKVRKTNRSLAEFVEISHAAELDAGVRESIATSKWLKTITGAKA